MFLAFPPLALSKSGFGSKVAPSSQPVCKLPVYSVVKQKTGDTIWMPPVKNRPMMTSYGGIIRIRLKGRSWMTSSQPATQAPLFLLIVIIHLNFQSSRVFLEKIQYVQNNTHFDTKNQRLPGIGKSTIAKVMLYPLMEAVRSGGDMRGR